MAKRQGGIALVVVGVVGLIVGILAIVFGVATMQHNLKNNAVYTKNLERIEAQTQALTAVPPSRLREQRVQQLHDEFLSYGGMKAETEQHFMIGLVSAIAGALFALLGLVLALVGLRKRPARSSPPATANA